MSGSSHPPERSCRGASVALVAAYAALGVALLWSRLYSLGHSFWTDEMLMVRDYVRAGPSHILTGPDLSHELLALLAWVTTMFTGESEPALRLLSAVPFVLGAVLVTAWLHARVGPLSGLLFLLLATVSPLLLDITRQARGYGLAFLAMSVLTISALDAVRTKQTRTIAAMCVAGVAGTFTLPQFGIAFLATAIAVATSTDLRRRTVIASGLSTAAILAWYAPHVGEIRSASQIEDGVQIGFPWLLTAPIDQILIPALVWIDGTALVAGLVWLPLVALSVVVVASSPLLQDQRAALILCAGPCATVIALWASSAYVIPRYLSFLLVPLFVLVATGAASIFERLRVQPALLRTVACLVVIVVLVGRFAAVAPDVVALPREAHRNAADAIASRTGPSTPVLAYMRNPWNLAFYLDRPVVDLDSADVSRAVCNARSAVVYVMQPFALDEVEVPCLDRPGVRHVRFKQYARGGEMNVWFVPAAG